MGTILDKILAEKRNKGTAGRKNSWDLTGEF